MASVIASNQIVDGKIQICELCEDEIDERVVMCVDCIAWLCDRCRMTHKRQKSTVEHECVAPDVALQWLESLNGSYQILCDEHQNQAVTSFCNKCQHLVCLTCLSSHKQHNIVSLLTAQKDQLKIKNEWEELLKKSSLQMEVEKDILSERIIETLARRKKNLDDIKLKSNELIDSIIQQENRMIEQVNGTFQREIDSRDKLFRQLNTQRQTTADMLVKLADRNIMSISELLVINKECHSLALQPTDVMLIDRTKVTVEEFKPIALDKIVITNENSNSLKPKAAIMPNTHNQLDNAKANASTEVAKQPKPRKEKEDQQPSFKISPVETEVVNGNKFISQTFAKKLTLCSSSVSTKAIRELLRNALKELNGQISHFCTIESDRASPECDVVISFQAEQNNIYVGHRPFYKSKGRFLGRPLKFLTIPPYRLDRFSSQFKDIVLINVLVISSFVNKKEATEEKFRRCQWNTIEAVL